MTTISSYFCHVVGERPERIRALHASTVKRTKAYAIAIHIPVVIWAVTSFTIAREIFLMESTAAALVSCFCAGLIYLVERLVLATPKSKCLNAGRVALGIVIAVLGASLVDLVIFDREVVQELKETEAVRIRGEFDKAITVQRKLVEQKKRDWDNAQAAANCEANGTCGSKLRSVGPVYRELARHAAVLRADFIAASVDLKALEARRSEDLANWRADPLNTARFGLLDRIEALEQFVRQHNAAMAGWALFFLLVLALELMVVIAKVAFKETVDDELEACREQLARYRVNTGVAALTTPIGRAESALEATLA